MDGDSETRRKCSAFVVVENEAESLPVREDKSSAGNLNDLDTCPVCHLNFHSREPKLLPCLHSFCKRCLPSPSRNLAMADPQNASVDSMPKPLNVIRCPVCRQECMESDVMENLFVKDSAEAPSSTMERTVQLCMTCDDNTEAAGYCVDCVEYLCATCVEAHQRVKFTKDHTIRQKEEALQEARGMSGQRPVFCDVHKQEPLKLFCETCDLLTCRDCQLLKHRDHSYQFLIDAYANHKQHMESMTLQLQEKKKIIEEVSNSINIGLLQVDQNRKSVHNEIKKSICSLILEINKKGKILVSQLEALTKDQESVLKKQQEDIGYLSRHLDHVIDFTKWASVKNGGVALLYCKRLILFQIGNLLRAKCSASFVPRNSVRFQCRSSYWGSNLDLGSLLVESGPGSPLGEFQGIPHQLHPSRRGPSGPPGCVALGPRLASKNTLAQLQMQVDKLNPPPHWQPQPQPPSWALHQGVRVQCAVPKPHQEACPSRNGLHGPPQSSRRFMAPLPSPANCLPSPGSTPQSVQPLRGSVSSSSYQPKPMDVFSPLSLFTHSAPLPSNSGLGSPLPRHLINPSFLNKGAPIQIPRPSYLQSLPPSYPHQNVQGQQDSPGYPPVCQEEKTGTGPWTPPQSQQADGALGSAAKRRRTSSAGHVVVIKDEPEDGAPYMQDKQRVNLPDSTGDQPQTIQAGGSKVLSPPPSEQESLPPPPGSPGPLAGGEQPGGEQPGREKPGGKQPGREQPGGKQPGREQPGGEQREAPVDSVEDGWCAVCQSQGQLLCCAKCPKVFHPTCHVPTLLTSPSGTWFCSLCRDLYAPEMEYDSDSRPEDTTVKEEPDSRGGLAPVDKRRCERLLLYLFCSEPSSDLQKRLPFSTSDNTRQAITTLIDLTLVKRHLEAKQSPCYQSPAEFISDIRLIFMNFAVCNQAHTEITMASRKLEELFEDHLRITYPEVTLPEIKMEAVNPASPSVSAPLS